MHDPFAWSFPLGRLFGITVRVHWLFPFVALGVDSAHRPLQASPEARFPEGLWIDATILMGILFVSVLLHEFGHCFAARAVNGDAQEVLLWPLGGLANVEVPHRPRAHFLTAAAGPAVNLFSAVICGLLLLVVDKQRASADLEPAARWLSLREGDGLVQLCTWSGTTLSLSPYALPVLAGSGLLGQLLPVPAQRRPGRLPTGRRPDAPGVLCGRRWAIARPR